VPEAVVDPLATVIAIESGALVSTDTRISRFEDEHA
jgi:hypothetical protein